jgi:hypothetical protein
LTISLEEALGLKPKAVALEVEADREEFSEADLKRLARRKLIFDRRCRGETIEEIYDFLLKNGTPASRKTIWNDLHSDQASEFVEELSRVQFRDIAILRGYALQDKESPDLKALAAAINARTLMIRTLNPKLEPKVNVEVNVANKTEHALLAEYAGVIKEAAVVSANISAVCAGESVDSQASSSGDKEKRSL